MSFEHLVRGGKAYDDDDEELEVVIVHTSPRTWISPRPYMIVDKSPWSSDGYIVKCHDRVHIVKLRRKKDRAAPVALGHLEEEYIIEKLMEKNQ